MSQRPVRIADLIRQPTEAERRTETAAPPLPPEPAPAVETSVPAPRIPEEIRPSAPAAESAPAEPEARRDYELLESWMESVLASARRGRLDAPDAIDNVRALIEPPSLADALFAETFRTRPAGRFLARKSASVAIYALRLGRTLGFAPQRLVELGAAGLLKSVGLAALPEEVLAKPGGLSRSERRLVREHPKRGRELVAALGPGFARVAEIVHQAAERVDGSGYPEGRRGEEILQDALAVGLVDVYEALIQPRPYRERLIPFEAVKELLERERERFPRLLLREFVSAFSVFPPFSYVRLNSRAVARVVETEPGHPLRPKVTIVCDASGRKPAEQQTLRLREAPLLYITGPVREEELPA